MRLYRISRSHFLFKKEFNWEMICEIMLNFATSHPSGVKRHNHIPLIFMEECRWHLSRIFKSFTPLTLIISHSNLVVRGITTLTLIFATPFPCFKHLVSPSLLLILKFRQSDTRSNLMLKS